VQFEWFDGRIILEERGTRVLVDTGAPRSVGTLEGWRFQGVPVALDLEVHGIAPKKLSDVIGTRIDVLLGMDFLGTRAFQIDVESREFRMLQGTETLPVGQTVPLKIVAGVPTVPVTVGNREVRAVLDTSAKLSYLPDELIGNTTTVGRVRDYHPTAGTFQSDVRMITARLGPAKATLRCGILPTMLEAALRVSGLHGIVGTDLLAQHVATFLMPRQLILS